LATFRVTRLGEFSHIGRLFSLVGVYKITAVARIVGLLFPWDILCINSEKMVGLHSWRFSHKLVWSSWLHFNREPDLCRQFKKNEAWETMVNVMSRIFFPTSAQKVLTFIT
jgi:hypothetical protein